MKLSLTTLIATLFLAVGQTPSSQPLIIVVRDGQGHPLEGVSLMLLAAGPPDEPFGACATGADGQCRLLVPPGAYIVRFDGKWQEQAFIPADQQNGGALSDGGASGGGFGIYVDAPPAGQGQTEKIVTFVVGRKDGQLVPLWDLSRSPFAPPQPYSPSANPFDATSNSLAGINLGAIPSSGATSEGTAQIAESQINPGEASTLPTPRPTPTPIDKGIPLASVLLGAIALIIMLVIAVVVLLFRRARRKERG